LTDAKGTSINEIEAAFHQVTIQNGSSSKASPGRAKPSVQAAGQLPRDLGTNAVRSFQFQQDLIGTIAAPYVQTFLPYFKDDPKFDRSNLTRACSELQIPEHTAIGTSAIARVAGIQLKHQKPASSNASDPVVPKPCGLGTDLLKRMSEGVDDVANSSLDWGISITGSGGGDWRFNLQSMQLLPAGQRCEQRLYCDRATWNELIEQKQSVVDALASGSLACEFNDHRSTELVSMPKRCSIEQVVMALIQFAENELTNNSIPGASR
jgi:hypothetical protein